MKELRNLIEKFRLSRKRDAETSAPTSTSAPATSTSSSSSTTTSTSSNPLPSLNSAVPYAPLLASTNLASSLPPLGVLFPSSSSSGLPDVASLLKAGQNPAFQDPLQLTLGANSLLSGGLPGLSPVDAASPSLTSALSEDRRAQLLQLIKLRSDRIAILQKSVEQGQGVILRLNREFNDWILAEKQKGEMQLAFQKTALQKSEQELEVLIKAQQSDVAEINTYNNAVKKAYIDSGLQLQNQLLQRAQLDEAKEKEEFDRSQKARKDIEAQVASLTQELQASSLGGSTTATTTPPPTTAKPV
jgi:hypothetical protein